MHESKHSGGSVELKSRVSANSPGREFLQHFLGISYLLSILHAISDVTMSLVMSLYCIGDVIHDVIQVAMMSLSDVID